MITTWAATDRDAVRSGLGEYAHRAYSGLLKDYYYPRWKLFFDTAR